ncbi:MAG: type ISP restriction/modification enzyme, partial [Dolichospermum sp.]
IRRPEFDIANDKLKFLSQTKFNQIPFDHIKPDQKFNWINQSDNDFEILLPLVDKNTEKGKSEQTIFNLFSISIQTSRDEWVYDFNKDNLIQKIKFFIEKYNLSIDHNDKNYEIKWTSSLVNYFERQIKAKFNENLILTSLYRPFIKVYHYTEKLLNHRLTQNHYRFFSNSLNKSNIIIGIMGQATEKDFSVLAVNLICDINAISPASGGMQCLPLYTYKENGNRIDNITDWGLKQIQTHYQDETITKIDIFHYTYAVLHNPEYCKKYELNLKREFPCLPYYENFQKWVNWGKQLMEIHINYETVTPYNLTRLDIPLKDTPSTSLRERQKTIKVKLKADKTKDSIILDDVTTLSNIPKIAWEYMLGNRSALEWILDQYKEKKPKDPTIAEKFNTYRFADYKEQVIDLLMRVCTVSVETMKIIKEMSESGSPGFEDFQDFRSPTSQTN